MSEGQGVRASERELSSGDARPATRRRLHEVVDLAATAGEQQNNAAVLFLGGLRAALELGVEENLVEFPADGFSFEVVDVDKFHDDVLKRQERKFASFERQLNTYGFVKPRLPTNPKRARFLHKNFRRHPNPLDDTFVPNDPCMSMENLSRESDDGHRRRESLERHASFLRAERQRLQSAVRAMELANDASRPSTSAAAAAETSCAGRVVPSTTPAAESEETCIDVEELASSNAIGTPNMLGNIDIASMSKIGHATLANIAIAINSPVALLNETLEIVYVSPSFADLLRGASSSELLGKRVEYLLPENSRRVLRTAMLSNLRNRVSWSGPCLFDTRPARNGGMECPAIRIVPIHLSKNASQFVAQAATIPVDQTFVDGRYSEFQRNEKIVLPGSMRVAMSSHIRACLTERELLQVLLAQSYVVSTLLQCFMDYRRLFVSPTCQAVTGYPATTLMVHSVQQVPFTLHPDDSQYVDGLIRAGLQTRSDDLRLLLFRFRRKCKDDRYRWFEAALFLLHPSRTTVSLSRPLSAGEVEVLDLDGDGHDAGILPDSFNDEFINQVLARDVVPHVDIDSFMWCAKGY